MWADSMSGRRNTKRTEAYALPEASPVRELALASLIRLKWGGAAPPLDFESDANGRVRNAWCAGHVQLLKESSVAIVGTRDVSDAGAARARNLAKTLATRGVVVVSGLARGVDTEALTASIQHGGRVIAVIGTPIDKAYPAENAALQAKIAADHLLVSQFAPGTKTFPGHFPMRNRLMAALSDATVIIEAGDTSGTLHQAAECVRLNRWLFIAKNVIDDLSLTWPANFKDYARVRTLTTAEDLFAVLPQ